MRTGLEVAVADGFRAMRGLRVSVDPAGTGGSPLRHELLGEQSADEVTRTALLQLSHLGVGIAAGGRAEPHGTGAR